MIFGISWADKISLFVTSHQKWNLISVASLNFSRRITIPTWSGISQFMTTSTFYKHYSYPDDLVGYPVTPYKKAT